MQVVQQFPVMCVELAEIMEDVLDELRETVARDDGWVHFAERRDVHLNGGQIESRYVYNHQASTMRD